MKFWVWALLFWSTHLLSQAPVQYQSQTKISANAFDAISFSSIETLDFECTFLSQDSLQLTFKRIRGEGHFGIDPIHSFKIDTDSDEREEAHTDLICLKRLLEVPLTVYLHPDLSIKKPNEDWAHFLELISQNDFFNESFLELLVQAILSPTFYDSQRNTLCLPLYYPFESKITLTPNLSLQKKGSEIFFDQDIDLEGFYSLENTSSKLCLSGELSGNIQWDKEARFSKQFSFSETLDEKSLKPLFDSPLQFNYSFNLKQVDHGELFLPN